MLDNLPPEILMQISKRLCPQDAAILAQVNRTQYSHASSPYRVNLMAFNYTQEQKDILLIKSSEIC